MVIVVGCGIIGFQKVVPTDCFGNMVSLCKEIVAIAGIRIANALVGVTPTNRTDSIKQALSINIAERYFL